MHRYHIRKIRFTPKNYLSPEIYLRKRPVAIFASLVNVCVLWNLRVKIFMWPNINSISRFVYQLDGSLFCLPLFCSSSHHFRGLRPIFDQSQWNKYYQVSRCLLKAVNCLFAHATSVFVSHINYCYSYLTHCPIYLHLWCKTAELLPSYTSLPCWLLPNYCCFFFFDNLLPKGCH